MPSHYSKSSHVKNDENISPIFCRPLFASSRQLRPNEFKGEGKRQYLRFAGASEWQTVDPTLRAPISGRAVAVQRPTFNDIYVAYFAATEQTLLVNSLNY